VILNRLGGRRHESKLRAVIEHYTDVPVIGAVQEDAELALVERHLGLMPANETAEAGRHIAAIGERIAAQVDLDRLLALSRTDMLPSAARRRRSRSTGSRCASPSPAMPPSASTMPTTWTRWPPPAPKTVFFDTLKDSRLPPCDGLLIGGGFPECFLGELEANTALRADIRRAIEAASPPTPNAAASCTWRAASNGRAAVPPWSAPFRATSACTTSRWVAAT
jgi:cobyrinic acid a,c-diamide synthase